MEARRAIVLLFALTVPLAGCIAAPGAQPLQTEDLPEVSQGPVSSFTELLCDVACNILVSQSSGPANELGLAMDPNNPLRLLGGGKDYNNRYTDCVTVSWYFSEDGGRTWTDGYYHPERAMALPHPGLGIPVPLGGLPVDPSNPLRVDSQSCESDPVPVFDGHGNALMSTLSYGGAEPGPGLPTYRLAPGATEWEQVAHSYEGTSDKQWADVDAESGEVYVITRDLKEGAEHSEELVKTNDGGATWQHLSYLDAIDFAQVAVRPGGHVYLVGLATEGDGVTIITMHSSDGGLTWDAPVTQAELQMGFSNQGLNPASAKLYRTPPLPVIAASDRVPTVAIAYFDEVDGDMDVFARISKDGGRTWSEPINVADAPAGTDQFIPAIAVSPAGDVHVEFFDARHDPTGEGRVLDVYYAHSQDGASFEPNLRITEQSFSPYFGRHQNQPFFMGDYLGIQASDQEAVMIWPDTREQTSLVFAAVVGGAPV